jgi:sphingomyelin phosphodiesterase 2
VSDHFSAEATLTFHVPSSSSSTARAEEEEAAAESTAAALSSGAYLQTQSPTPSETTSSCPFTAQLHSAALAPDSLPSSTYDEILSLTSAYTARERSERRLRLYHFFASLPVWIACLVGTFFTPPFASFLLSLVGSLSLLAGAVDGLIGLLFVGRELRALKEFAWEVAAARAARAPYAGPPSEAVRGLSEDLKGGEGRRV